jgi:hypothetical protein
MVSFRLLWCSFSALFDRPQLPSSHRNSSTAGLAPSSRCGCSRGVTAVAQQFSLNLGFGVDHDESASERQAGVRCCRYRARTWPPEPSQNPTGREDRAGAVGKPTSPDGWGGSTMPSPYSRSSSCLLALPWTSVSIRSGIRKAEVIICSISGRL